MARSRQRSQTERAVALGQRLRQRRRELKLTQRQVAEQIPMSAGNLSRIENGDQGPPSDETIARLARALDLAADELLELVGHAGSGSDLERRLLRELGELRKDVRAGFERLEQALERR